MAWVDLHRGILEEFTHGYEFDEDDFFRHGLSILLREQVVVAHDRPDTCAHCSGVIPEKRKHKRVAKYCSKKCSLAGVREEYKASGRCIACSGPRQREDRTQCDSCLEKMRNNKRKSLTCQDKSDKVSA